MKSEDQHREWPDQLPVLLFQRPLRQPWEIVAAHGQLLTAFECAGHQFATVLRQGLGPQDGLKLEGLFAQGQSYFAEYRWKSMLLQERATLQGDHFLCLLVRNPSVRDYQYLRVKNELEDTRQALHHSERSASELRDRVALALEVAEIGIWSLDFATMAVDWDDAMYQIYGRSPAESITLTDWRELIVAEDRHHIDGFLGQQESYPERQVTHFRILRRDGDSRFVKAAFGVLLGEQGDAIGWVGAHVDVTELHEIQEALRVANLTAEDANQAKSRFLATVSHEIRTPMNAILGLAHLVRLTELTPRQDDYLQKLERAAQSMLEIVNDILDFSKIEAGKLSLETVDFQLSDVLDNLGQLLQVRARDKPGLEILLSVDPEVPEFLHGDPLRLGQVLLNLGGNAVKFTEHGEVVVGVRCLHRENSLVILEFVVSDTGIGLRPEQMPSLFQPFSQADSSTARKYGGTGLGLSISQQLVDLMGGHIWAEAGSAGGARFVFTARLENSRAHQDAQERIFSPEHSNLRVLIVDDNSSARRILSAMIGRFGFFVDLADSGESALAQARETCYDLILMDWRLSGIDGLEASRRIRHLARGAEPIILLVTAYEGDEFLKQPEVAPVDGLMRKPISESYLYDSIQTALHRRQQGGFERFEPKRWIRQPEARYQARVLLVEDHEINRLVAGEMLTLRGIQVCHAATALEAMDCLRRQEFDLAFMDVQMPGIDGLEATRRIRADGTLRQIPIVAMTANAMLGDRERCLQAGMTDYLSKPIDPLALHDILEKYLGPLSQLPLCSLEGWDGDETIETRAALDRLGGNLPLYLRLLAQFDDRNRNLVSSLQRALEEGLDEAVRGLAHTLKGSADNLGIVQVARLAGQLEQLSPTSEAERAALLPRLQAELDRALESIRALRQLTPPAAASRASSDAQLAAVLQELKSFLRVDLGRTLSLSERMVDQFVGHPLFDGLEAVHNHLHEFATDEAEEALEAVWQRLQGGGQA
ncbi:MAG: response regulator [Candidatus Eremiobacteraeota bacterium]|nr:response regulator [Candidatus Eremiobacteraeota bacterium]